MFRGGIKQAWLAFWAGRFISQGDTKITSGDLFRSDFSSSTQRLGLRFTDRIRQTFRFRWLRRQS